MQEENDSRPKCEFNISEKCTSEKPQSAIMIENDKEGTSRPCCHYCSWKMKVGCEWNPKRR